MDIEPMKVAEQFERRSRQKKRLADLVKRVNEEVARLESDMLKLIEDGKLPPSFRGALGGSIYTREDIWASAANKDHGRLVAALRAEGLVEFLPSNVNSQSLSAYVREHYNKKTGEFEGLSSNLLEALNITIKQRVIASG